MDRSKTINAYFLGYIPGLLVLAISMFALYSAVVFINEHDHILALENYHDALGAHELNDGGLVTNEIRLYWSVIILGLSGFVLVLLNSNKVMRLKHIDQERQAAFKLSQKQLAAMEVTQDGIGITDADGRLIYINKALMKLHAIAPDDVDQFIGQSWEHLYNEAGQTEIKGSILPQLGEDGYWQGSSSILRKDGKTVEAELSITRLPDGGLIGTARDVTEKIKEQQEKKELQDQFYQSQKMEAVGRLAGGIAHDFNNILAAMNGYAEFLVEDLADSTVQHGFARNILRAGTQARSLVDQMLTFSRRENGEATCFNLLVPVNESISMLQATLPKSMEIETDIHVNLAPIEGSATQVSQLIMNLCVNARDAMEEEDKGKLIIGVHGVNAGEYEDLGLVADEFPNVDEKPVVRIEDGASGQTRLFLSHLVRDQNYIKLSVRDNGSGMDRVVMEHVFEPFFTTKPADKGTGLGLSTVHGVVVKHCGAMIVESKVGEGTVFELFFPLTEGTLVANKVDETSDRSNVADAHIHLVEDQNAVREMVMTMLQRLGYEVTYSTTGAEALEYLKEAGCDVDLVITDYNMPEMTGLEMVSQINPLYPELPFVLLSGYSEKKLQDLIEDYPAVKAVVRKPAAREVLSQAIELAFKARSSDAASQA